MTLHSNVQKPPFADSKSPSAVTCIRLGRGESPMWLNTKLGSKATDIVKEQSPQLNSSTGGSCQTNSRQWSGNKPLRTAVLWKTNPVRAIQNRISRTIGAIFRRLDMKTQTIITKGNAQISLKNIPHSSCLNYFAKFDADRAFGTEVLSTKTSRVAAVEKLVSRRSRSQTSEPRRMETDHRKSI